MKKVSKHSSDMLMEILDSRKSKQFLTFYDILQKLGEQAFGIVLLFFALPSVLPVSAIPGVSFLFSVPIIIFAFQMVLARKTLWLPKKIAEHKIKYKTIHAIISISVPYLKKIEHILKPRLSFMTHSFMQPFNGIIILFLALLLALPIPFSNIILGTLLVIFSLGLIEQDGVFILLCYIGTIIYLSFMYLLILAALKGIF